MALPVSECTSGMLLPTARYAVRLTQTAAGIFTRSRHIVVVVESLPAIVLPDSGSREDGTMVGDHEGMSSSFGRIGDSASGEEKVLPSVKIRLQHRRGEQG